MRLLSQQKHFSRESGPQWLPPSALSPHDATPRQGEGGTAPPRTSLARLDDSLGEFRCCAFRPSVASEPLFVRYSRDASTGRPPSAEVLRRVTPASSFVLVVASGEGRDISGYYVSLSLDLPSCVPPRPPRDRNAQQPLTMRCRLEPGMAVLKIVA